jgi:hypothetical protein
MLFRRSALAAATVFTSFALMTAPAFAKGGPGGTPAPPPPAPVQVSLCPDFASGGTYLPDGSLIFANDIYDAACLIARLSPTGALTIEELRLAPGWVADIKSSGGGSSNRIAVDFSNTATGQKHSFLSEPGKAVLK